MVWQSVWSIAYDSGRRLRDMIAVCESRAVKRYERFLRVGIVVEKAEMEAKQEMLGRCRRVECEAEREMMNAPVAETRR